jgi:hypothetical protein
MTVYSQKQNTVFPVSAPSRNGPTNSCVLAINRWQRLMSIRFPYHDRLCVVEAEDSVPRERPVQERPHQQQCCSHDRARLVQQLSGGELGALLDGVGHDLGDAGREDGQQGEARAQEVELQVGHGGDADAKEEAEEGQLNVPAEGT